MDFDKPKVYGDTFISDGLVDDDHTVAERWMVIRKVDFARWFYLLRKSPFLLPVSFSDHSTRPVCIARPFLTQPDT